MADKYLTVEDAVRSYGVSQATLYVMMRSAELHYIKHGRTRLLPEAELMAWQAAKPGMLSREAMATA